VAAGEGGGGGKRLVNVCPEVRGAVRVLLKLKAAGVGVAVWRWVAVAMLPVSCRPPVHECGRMLNGVGMPKVIMESRTGGGVAASATRHGKPPALAAANQVVPGRVLQNIHHARRYKEI